MRQGAATERGRARVVFGAPGSESGQIQYGISIRIPSVIRWLTLVLSWWSEFLVRNWDWKDSPPGGGVDWKDSPPGGSEPGGGPGLKSGRCGIAAAEEDWRQA